MRAAKLSLRGVGQPLCCQFHPVGAAQRNQVVIEVVAWIVQHAGACAVTHFAVRAIAVGNEDIGAGLGLQHEGEIFGTHGGFLRHHVVFAHYAFHHLACKVGLGRAVDGGRVVAVEVKFGLGIESRTQVFCDLLHAVFNEVEHFNAESAHGALNDTEVGHHVGGFAGVDHGDRNNASIDRLFVAGDDGLKGLNQLASHWHRVNAVVGQRCVAAFAANGNFEFVAGRHDRTGADCKGAHLSAWPVVHAKHGLHGELVEHAVFDHFTGAAAAFFGRLENEVHGAIKIAVFGEVLGSRQQHGCVAIVTASVHFAVVLAGVCKGVELLHGQGVHVGSEAHTSAAGAAITAVHDADDAGGAHAAVNGDAPVCELLGHHIGGANFFEAQLGVGVDVFSNGRNAGRVCENGVDDFHSNSLARLVPLRYKLFAIWGYWALGLSPKMSLLE
jgi:hypothetical protein